MRYPSRIERAHGRFAVAFGVDHVTGPYCQVWLAPIDEQESALIIVDNRGVQAEGWKRELGASHQAVERWVRGVAVRHKQAVESGNRYPNIDHATVSSMLVHILGFPPSIIREVFEAFD